MSVPAGMEVRNATCDGCEKSHTTIWRTVTDAGKFRGYCLSCWPRYVGVWA